MTCLRCSGLAMARVKREIGKVRCCPRNGKQVWVYPQATGPSAWEGDTPRLASPDTGPKRLAKVPRGVGAGPFFSLQFVLLHPP